MNFRNMYDSKKQRIDLDETQSLTKVKETISELKNKIKNLGPVNINAVEDYKEVSERYEFMQKQHEDIVTAEAHLTGLMEELEDATGVVGPRHCMQIVNRTLWKM